MENENRLRAFHNISLWIDSYDDIFSDFDPRPISQRRLSDDFLIEVKKVSRENEEEEIRELIFLIPEKVRNEAKEARVIKRLHKHFRIQYKRLSVSFQKTKQKGVLQGLLGMAMMFAASFIEIDDRHKWINNALRIMLEPPGWFLVWTGFETYLHTWKNLGPDLEFYEKMSKSKVRFNNL